MQLQLEPRQRGSTLTTVFCSKSCLFASCPCFNSGSFELQHLFQRQLPKNSFRCSSISNNGNDAVSHKFLAFASAQQQQHLRLVSASEAQFQQWQQHLSQLRQRNNSIQIDTCNCFPAAAAHQLQQRVPCAVALATASTSQLQL